jgi:hypothetical protein
MIKRFGAITLTLLYLVTMSGIALNLHYCFNQVTSINFNAPVKTCGMLLKSKMKCCRDEHVQVKVKDVHEVQPVSFLSGLSCVILPKACYPDLSFSFPQATAFKSFGKAPPDLLSQASFIKNCVFRI